MKNVTKHARKRLKQRNINKGRNGISTSAKLKGKSKFFYEGQFHDYLTSKSSDGKIVKVYKDNVYIYSKNSKNLITTYAVPKKYIPTEQYLMKDSKIKVLEKIALYYRRNCVITLKNGTVITGIITRKVFDYKNVTIGIIAIDDENYRQEILIDEIEAVEIDRESFNREIFMEMELNRA